MSIETHWCGGEKEEGEKIALQIPLVGLNLKEELKEGEEPLMKDN